MIHSEEVRTPKSFRELAREWMEEFHRISSQHFGDVRAEDIANNYRVLAQELNALADEWERRIEGVADKGGTYVGLGFILSHMLGAKERR